jgi:hypothetical protein
MKKTFDAVAFMRKRREELSHAYAGLSAEQIKERIRQALKDNPLWKPRPNEQIASDARGETGSADRPSGGS